MSGNAESASFRRRIESRVRRFMAAEDLWPHSSSLLVAVSGGQDSTALLAVLAKLAERQSSSLAVAYFDHGLRNVETIEVERTYVAALAEGMGLEFCSGAADCREAAKRDRLSLEEAARRERYRFLADTARRLGVKRVATGHTLTDQAETVLMRMARGAGLPGLAGMRPISTWPVEGGQGLSLIRPLLQVERQETAAYCAAASLQPLADVTNDDPAFLRNRIRNQVMPLLRDINPLFETSLTDLARDAAMAEAVLEAGAAAAVRRDDASAGIPLREFRKLDEVQQTRVAYIAVAAAAGDNRGFYRTHYAAIERLLRRGRTGDRLDLPRFLQARRTRDEVIIGKAVVAPSLPEAPVYLTEGAEACFGHLRVACTESRPEGEVTAVEVAATAVDGLHVRRRRNGDRFQPLGMTGKKKLQDFFVDAHVPREERDRVPLFVSGRGIAWVGGHRIAGWARAVPGEPTLWLSFRPTP